MNNPVWIDDKGKIIEPEYCQDFLSRHPMRCINDRFYTVEGPLPDESKLKRTIYEEISPWLHAKVAQTVEQVIKALKLAAYTDPLPLQCDRIHVANGTYFLDGTFTEEKEYCNNRLSGVLSSRCFCTGTLAAFPFGTAGAGGYSRLAGVSGLLPDFIHQRTENAHADRQRRRGKKSDWCGV